MALWTTHQNLSHDLNTALVLLTDALNSALNDALFFERAACRKPEMKGAGHAEIAARLTRFRESGNEFRAREALMLTKINRARKWAAELRRLAPEMQDDVDQFLDATEDCDKFLSEFSHDAQRAFNGGSSLSRFLARRQGDGTSGEPAGASPKDYRIGGETAIFELRAACEVFLGQVNEQFSREEPAQIETSYVDPIAISADLPDAAPDEGIRVH